MLEHRVAIVLNQNTAYLGCIEWQMEQCRFHTSLDRRPSTVGGTSVDYNLAFRVRATCNCTARSGVFPEPNKFVSDHLLKTAEVPRWRRARF